MKLFLWMAAFIAIATILGEMIGAGQGIPFAPEHLPGLLFNSGLIVLLLLAWWLSRRRGQKP